MRQIRRNSNYIKSVRSVIRPLTTPGQKSHLYSIARESLRGLPLVPCPGSHVTIVITEDVTMVFFVLFSEGDTNSRTEHEHTERTKENK